MFSTLIRDMLSIGNLSDTHSSYLVENYLNDFEQAFTHETIDPVNNYQTYEFIGDSIVNTCIIRYLYDKYPNLHSKEGVQVLTRMKITIICKNFLAKLATDCGFKKHIKADELHQTNHIKSLLEDTFEAFFGAVSVLVDRHILDGAGFGVCKHLLYHIMDKHPLDYSYETLVDPVTRMKELCDYRKLTIGTKYVFDDATKTFSCSLTYNNVVIGSGKAYKKKQAYNQACETGIQMMKHLFNIYKEVPECYEKLKR